MNADEMLEGFMQSVSEKTGCTKETAGVLALITGLLAFKFLSGPRERPAWLKDCEPVGLRRAGAWRGKGSFGTHFGPQTQHR